jgi:hypothetical protein
MPSGNGNSRGPSRSAALNDLMEEWYGDDENLGLGREWDARGAEDWDRRCVR